jgi:nitrogen fixation protein NifU and related proteins
MSDTQDIYNATILERARSPRHRLRLEIFDAEASETNPLCGDRVVVRLRCDAEKRIAAIGYEARACAICIAAADIMAELAEGIATEDACVMAETFEQALRSGTQISADLGMAPLRVFAPLHETPSRIGCATLPWRSLTRAIGMVNRPDQVSSDSPS